MTVKRDRRESSRRRSASLSRSNWVTRSTRLAFRAVEGCFRQPSFARAAAKRAASRATASSSVASFISIIQSLQSIEKHPVNAAECAVRQGRDAVAPSRPGGDLGNDRRDARHRPRARPQIVRQAIEVETFRLGDVRPAQRRKENAIRRSKARGVSVLVDRSTSGGAPRLEHGPEPARWMTCAKSAQGLVDRRRMVREVVVNEDTSWLTEQILPSSNALERRQVTSSVARRDAEPLGACRDRRNRVSDVVTARHFEKEAPTRDAPGEKV